MSRPIPIVIATEDLLGESIAERLLAGSSRAFEVRYRLGKQGVVYLKDNVLGWNRTIAPHCPVLVLADLDMHPCAGELLEQWVPRAVRDDGLLLRLAVREAEAWLLADDEGVSKLLGVSKVKVPPSPENLDDPKATLISLARRGRRRSICDGMVPIGRSKTGPEYNAILGQFVSQDWRPDVASRRASSLKRTMMAIQRFVLRRSA